MTYPLPHPERRSSFYPAHHRDPDTDADDGHLGPSTPFTVPPADPAEHTGHQETHLGHDAHSSHGGHGGHGLMMLVCCIPMVAVAVLLVVSGTASAGALVWVLGCMLMMAAMMFLMPGGHGHK